MDQHSLHEIEARCTQESPPRCRVACPFSLDVRAFLAFTADGRMPDARKLYERHIPLPGIMGHICDHPCEAVCLRRDVGGSIALHALEAFCVNAVPAQTKPLPLPPKKGSMAVLGAGLAGLAAAWDLSRKGYAVTVFHEGAVEAVLVQRYPALHAAATAAANALAEDLDMLTRQKVVFSPAVLNAACLAAAEAAFDVLLIDMDAAAALAPVEAHVDGITRHLRDRLCAAGSLATTPTGHAYASASTQAGQGRQAARTMERLAGKVSLTAARDKEQGPLHTALDNVAVLPRVEPVGALYTEAEAVSEAARCLQCSCMICVRECVYLQKYKGYPRTYARQIYNNASIVKGLHTANEMVNGCALCGQCEELCPENFSMAELCLSARQDMVEREFMPPSAHEFALEDMESASAGDCALTLLPGAPLAAAHNTQPGAAARRLFFPGCQLAAARGTQTAALYAFLRASLDDAGADAGSTAIMLSCCGIPAHWAGREALFSEHGQKIRAAWEGLGKPDILTACSSCLTALRKLLPEARLQSVWEALDGLPLPAQARASAAFGGSAALPEALWVHDPCTARHDLAWRTAVRSLAVKCGARLAEPCLSGVTTPCCGYGGLLWCAQPELAQAMTEQRAAQLPGPALASCIMCRDRLAAAGTECLHLLDVLFPDADCDDVAGCAIGRRKGPGLSARRSGRAALRRQLLREYAGQNVSEPAALALHVSEELLQQMEARHILLSDVQHAVAAVEAAQTWFENTLSGHRLGAHRPRRVTFWVEYEVLPDTGAGAGAGYLLHDAWCHRMIVPNAGGEAEAAGCEGGCA